ncbi:hypothetical protein TKK_0019625 [Trichogramma kaykai]|uniref:Uncharacterized protein n=1 Tax=Trichogramma kaykai TaxID=54128 RepID=A0ABD2VSU8_9HYME
MEAEIRPSLATTSDSNLHSSEIEIEIVVDGIETNSNTATFVNEQLKAMAVSNESPETIMNSNKTRITNNYNNQHNNDCSSVTSSNILSSNENLNNLIDSTFTRMMSKTVESGSCSGDQDHITMEEGYETFKKRKTRRGKPKHRKLKPYFRQAYLQCMQRCRTASRSTRNKWPHPPPPPPQPASMHFPQTLAPYNTTQFLIEDHNSELPDLEEKIADATSHDLSSNETGASISRTRDSSFSIDSDDDYFYSSPEDEEEFLTKEFRQQYENLHIERLNSLTKAQLITEYIELESRYEMVMKKRELNSNNDGDNSREAKICKKFQQRIEELIQQKEQLIRKVDALQKQLQQRRAGSPMSSIDSESDSDSDSSNNSGSSCARSINKNSPSSTPSAAPGIRLIDDAIHLDDYSKICTPFLDDIQAFKSPRSQCSNIVLSGCENLSCKIPSSPSRELQSNNGIGHTVEKVEFSNKEELPD